MTLPTIELEDGRSADILVLKTKHILPTIKMSEMDRLLYIVSTVVRIDGNQLSKTEIGELSPGDFNLIADAVSVQFESLKV